MAGAGAGHDAARRDGARSAGHPRRDRRGHGGSGREAPLRHGRPSSRPFRAAGCRRGWPGRGPAM